MWGLWFDFWIFLNIFRFWFWAWWLFAGYGTAWADVLWASSLCPRRHESFSFVFECSGWCHTASHSVHGVHVYHRMRCHCGGVGGSMLLCMATCSFLASNWKSLQTTRVFESGCCFDVWFCRVICCQQAVASKSNASIGHGRVLRFAISQAWIFEGQTSGTQTLIESSYKGASDFEVPSKCQVKCFFNLKPRSSDSRRPQLIMSSWVLSGKDGPMQAWQPGSLREISRNVFCFALNFPIDQRIVFIINQYLPFDSTVMIVCYATRML